MTSQINPNTIDSAYPVAGQDNSTQGFRDNFSFIKQNFTYAATEITALQANTAVVNSTNYFNNNLLYGARVQDFAQVRQAFGNVSGNANVSYAAGHYQTMTLNGNTAVNFSDFPSGATNGFLTLAVTVANVAYSLTLPTAVGTGSSAASLNGIQGISSRTISFNQAGTYEFDFASNDGGASIFVSERTRPRNQFMNPLQIQGSEDLASGAAANLRLTTSYFSTGGAETATLAAGTDGQIKVFAMAADSGDMVITVTNAGWKTSGTGTITFNDIGDAVTLLYTNSKWYCIGNNGCSFA
jgi:hypothetical protein